MDSSRIEELLKKYWDCETSLEEEQQLREYFNQEKVPEKWRETAALFRYFEGQKSKEVQPAFDDHLRNKIRERPHLQRGKVRYLVFNAMRIAAGITVLVAAIYLVRQEIRQEDPIAVEDTYTDPKQAFEETKKALLMISKGFGTAEQQAKKINMLNEAREKVQATTKEEEKEL
ncbi:MAG: hypothetical protein MUC73_04110 [Cyclobacteriaceae bacterium]|jgi:hypothetical protein|nr:hypothetical protein [Cyclobacteriaceae bacterium]